ncbi:hypothetical protein [Staphylococcus aureus]
MPTTFGGEPKLFAQHFNFKHKCYII